MYKIIATLMMLLSAFSVQASEVKVNLPISAHHMSDRDDGGKWNESFIDDLAFGVSYKHQNGFGLSVTQSINSYGENRSVYSTIDYMPTIYSDSDIFKVNVGGHVGFATGYDELSRSGVIPLVGASTELEIGNVSFMGTVLPSYKSAPVTFIGMARIKLHEWNN